MLLKKAFLGSERKREGRGQYELKLTAWETGVAGPMASSAGLKGVSS